MNPQHKIPFLVDGDDFKIGESRAIQIYLCDQYGKDSSLYPSDPKKRGIVNHRLFFDCSTMFPRFLDAFVPLVFENSATDIPLEKRQSLIEGMEILDKLIGDNKWVAGDHETIADHGLIAIISVYEAISFGFSQYANISRWMKTCKENIKDYDTINGEGAQKLGNIFKEAFK